MKRLTVRGLTLIELLVAIAIFALLGMMSYKAIYGATEGQERLSEEYLAWQRVSRCFNRIESELTQIASRAQGVATSKIPALVVSSGEYGGVRLTYTRVDNIQGAKLAAIEYADGRIALLRWKTMDTLQEPSRDVLLTGVQRLRWQYAARGDSTWRDTWPVSSTRSAEAPDGVRLEIELEGKGKLSRVFALR